MAIADDDIDYASSHVGLVDALRDYIRANEAARTKMINQNTLTPQMAHRAAVHIAQCYALLREIEEHNFDPTLCGVIKGKSQ